MSLLSSTKKLFLLRCPSIMWLFMLTYVHISERFQAGCFVVVLKGALCDNELRCKPSLKPPVPHAGVAQCELDVGVSGSAQNFYQFSIS